MTKIFCQNRTWYMRYYLSFWNIVWLLRLINFKYYIQVSGWVPCCKLLLKMKKSTCIADSYPLHIPHVMRCLTSQPGTFSINVCLERCCSCCINLRTTSVFPVRWASFHRSSDCRNCDKTTPTNVDYEVKTCWAEVGPWCGTSTWFWGSFRFLSKFSNCHQFRFTQCNCKMD